MNPTSPALSIPAHIPPELVIDFDATHDSALAVDLFKRLAEVRDSAPPVAYSPYNGGHWLVFSRDLIKQVLTSPEIYSSAHISAGSMARGGPAMIPLDMDPPEHGPWRMILMKHFGPARVKALEAVIRNKADELIASLDGVPSCDFVKAVAEPMPISIFMALMGLPFERFPEFRELAITALSGSDPTAPPPPQVVMANGKIMAILAEVIASRSQSPGTDLVSALVQETVNGKPLGSSELMSICYVLFLGGLDTVTNAMSFGMRYLAQNPPLQEQIRAHPERIPEMVENLLKLSAFVNTNRMVKVDTQLGGVAMKAGDVIWNMSWAGSNEPGDDSADTSHLAFGGGPHMCAGMHLARLELRAMYESWFRQRGPFALAPDPQPAMKGGPIMEIKRLLLDLQPQTSAAPATGRTAA